MPSALNCAGKAQRSGDGAFESPSPSYLQRAPKQSRASLATALTYPSLPLSRFPLSAFLFFCFSVFILH
jgi:hypothetical protein